MNSRALPRLGADEELREPAEREQVEPRACDPGRQLFRYPRTAMMLADVKHGGASET